MRVFKRPVHPCADPAGRGPRGLSLVRACALLTFLCAHGVPLRAEPPTPCTTLQALVEIQAAVARFGPEAGDQGAAAAAVRGRLATLDRMALAGLRAEEEGGFVGKLVFQLFEILEAVEKRDAAAIEARITDPEFREAGASLAALSASLSCRRAPVAGGNRPQGRPPTHPVDFSYVRDHWTAALSIILAALGVVGSATWRISRRSERLARTFTCNVTVHVTTETSTGLGSLIEIGRKGGKVRLAVPLQTGAKIRIQWDAEWHEAVVAWSNQHFTGLRFPRLIEPRTIEVIRNLSMRLADPDDAPTRTPTMPPPSEEIRPHAAL